MKVISFSEARNQPKSVLERAVEGIGKPEPLRENLSGISSRRIDDNQLTILSCRYQYET